MYQQYCHTTVTMAIQGGSTRLISSLSLLLSLLVSLLLLPDTVGKKTNLTASSIPTSDDGCFFDYRIRRCEPVSHCHYKYRFLDATFSESCRLKVQKPRVTPYYKGKIAGNPAVIAAGATALFGMDIAAIIFTPLLQNFPISFNVVQGFILCLAGDTYFQILEQGGLRGVKKVGVKAWRAVRSGLIGALNNGLIHYSYYKYIDRRFPYHLFTEERFGKAEGTYYKLCVAWAKYWIEWPTIGVYKIASMMVLTAALDGGVGWKKRFAKLPEKFRKRFLLTWLRSLQVWPVYDTILYAYVPASHRPLFNTFMSIAWGGYLSSISQPAAEESGEGGIGVLEELKEAVREERERHVRMEGGEEQEEGREEALEHDALMEEVWQEAKEEAERRRRIMAGGGEEEEGEEEEDEDKEEL